MSKQYLFSAQVLNKKNFNPLNIVAYYSGQVQLNAFNKERFIPDSKKQVLYSNLVVPQNDLYEHLPDYLKIKNKKKDIIDNARNIMWKNIDFFERRMDSQFARLFEVTVPSFLTKEESVNLVNTYASSLANQGMVVDTSIHKTNTAKNNIFGQENQKSDEQQDYSCFFLCTLRPFENGTFQNKNREWNTKDQFIVWRKMWLDLLKSAMLNAQAAQTAKSTWESKLSMYPEFDKKSKVK